MKQFSLVVKALSRSTVSLNGNKLFNESKRLREFMIYFAENASLQGLVLHEMASLPESIILGDHWGHIEEIDDQRAMLEQLIKELNNHFKNALPNENFDRLFPDGILVHALGGWMLSDKLQIKVDTLDLESAYNEAAHPDHEIEISEWNKVVELYKGPYLGHDDYANEPLVVRSRRSELASFHSYALTRIMLLQRTKTSA